MNVQSVLLLILLGAAFVAAIRKGKKHKCSCCGDCKTCGKCRK